MAMTDGQPVTVPAFEVTPVDTTGAGDSFNAGFLHAWLRGWNLDAAMLFASACGALSTLAAGGTGSQPSEEEVNRFMREALR
jgi:sugar/nucleoside kinase (ribokinase family)